MSGGSRLDRIHEIERAQRLKSWVGAARVVLVGQVLFAAFVFGHSRGPMPMPPMEMVAGMSVTLLLTLLLVPFFARRETHIGTDEVGWLREGRHRRRLLVFDDCFIVDGEVVLFDQVLRHRLDPEALSVRYFDPKHDGPVQRDFEAPPRVLERLARRFPPVDDASRLRGDLG
jgi:hypothetical protein